jgi:hypothetical protein
MFERHDQKLAFLCFRAAFVSNCPLFWGSVDIYKEYDSLYILERNDKKNSSFLRLWPFTWTIAHSFGVPGWFTRAMTLSTFWVPWLKTRRFCVLGPFSWAIAHSFEVPGWFTMTMTLSTCLWGTTKNSSFWCFRAVFVSYCPLFWGSMDIYNEYDSLYILERNDKKTRRFCVYGRFCELLPIVLGFRGDL